jgi:cell division protein ZapA
MSFVQNNNIVSIRILGKHYNIKCPPEQAEALQESARVLENKLRDMNQATSSTNTDRILVVTALNLCHELQTMKKEKSGTIGAIENKIQGLQSRIQEFLSADEELLVT